MRDILCVDDDDLSDISMTSLSSISSCSTTTTTFTITDTSQVVVASPPFQVPSCDDENVVTPKDNSMSSISIPSSGSLSKDRSFRLLRVLQRVHIKNVKEDKFI